MTTDRDGAEQRDDEEIPWLPPGVAAADEEPEDDEDEQDDDLFLESYGQDLEAPWAPVPVAEWQAQRRADPSKNLRLIFPEVAGEDATQRIQNVSLAEAQGYIDHETAAKMVAAELEIEHFDYHGTQRAIVAHRQQYPEVGAGDAMARRVAGVMLPGGGDAEDAQEPRRADLSGPARARFRRQQREVIVVERDPQTLLISKLKMGDEAAGDDAPPGEAPAPSAPESVDLEAAIRAKRLGLQAKRAEEDTAAHERRIQFRREVLGEGRRLAQQLKEAKEQKVSKTTANYRFSSPTEQRAKFGRVLESCGRCRFFLAPDACSRVEGLIRSVDLCDLFVPKTKPAP